MKTENDIIYNSIIIACVIGIVMLSVLVMTNTKDEGFIELYFLDYTKVPEKNTVTFKYGISNHQKENINCSISFLIDSQAVKNKRIFLKDNETFIEEYTLLIDSEKNGIHRISVEIKYLNDTQEIHFLTAEARR